MASEAIILSTLERVGELCQDPTPQVYEALFAMHPEFEDLFVLDRDGGVRGAMVQHALECIIDQVGQRRIAAAFLAAEKSHHEGYGVPPDIFGQFFIAMRNSFQTILGSEWTPEIDREWDGLLRELSELT